MPASASEGFTGLWLTENKRSVIKVDKCDQGLCGYIYWIIEGGMQIDSNNPDPAKRKNPMCGTAILWGFDQDSPRSWSGGRIYKADDGDIYKSNLTLQENGTLKGTPILRVLSI